MAKPLKWLSRRKSFAMSAAGKPLTDFSGGGTRFVEEALSCCSLFRSDCEAKGPPEWGHCLRARLAKDKAYGLLSDRLGLA